MKERDVSRADVVFTLRSGVVDPPELEGGTWRYRVRTPELLVVVALDDDNLTVISTWRIP